MNACHICDVDLLDDPHWHDELEVLVCDRCCPNEGCLLLPGDGSAPDEAPSSATGDDSAPHSAVVPAAGGFIAGRCSMSDHETWTSRDAVLPFDPPGLRGRFGFPGRCWQLRWRDRLGWRLFCLVAHHDHTSVVWRTFRDTRRADSTTWTFPDGGSSGAQNGRSSA